MNRSNVHRTLGGFVILLAMIACALPTQTIQPTVGIDPNAIETSIAGTLQASAKQTEQTNPAPASATPFPTEVLTPTPNISVSGTSLIVRGDQSTLFTDYKAGIQLVIPTGWMALRLNEEEYLRAFDSDVVLQNPAILERINLNRDLDPIYFRLEAIDIRPGHIPDGIISVINVIFEPDDVRSLEEWEQAERDRYHPQAGFKFISSSYPQVANGARVLVIEQSWAADSGENTTYYRGVFFRLPSGTVVLDFYTHFGYRDAMLLEFDQVVNSLTPIIP